MLSCEAAADHGVGLYVHAGGQGFERGAAHLRLVDLPVVPAP